MDLKGKSDRGFPSFSFELPVRIIAGYISGPVNNWWESKRSQRGLMLKLDAVAQAGEGERE